MRLLLEAPWLPAPAVPSFLAATLPLGPDWATAALSTANNLVLLRPPDRWGGLGLRVLLNWGFSGHPATQRQAS